MKNISTYFKKGFELANKSLELYFISALLLILIILSRKLWLVSLIPTLLSVGFIFTLPVFLLKKYRKEDFDLKKVFSLSLSNLIRRLIIPVILSLFAIGMVLGVVVVIISKILSNLSFPAGTSSSILHLIPLIGLYLILPLLVFSTILFSIEKKGFFSSLNQSVSLSTKNFNFIIYVFVFDTAVSAANSFLVHAPNNIYMLGEVLTQYVSFVVIASSLIYYIEVIKGKSKK